MIQRELNRWAVSLKGSSASGFTSVSLPSPPQVPMLWTHQAGLVGAFCGTHWCQHDTTSATLSFQTDSVLNLFNFHFFSLLRFVLPWNDRVRGKSSLLPPPMQWPLGQVTPTLSLASLSELLAPLVRVSSQGITEELTGNPEFVALSEHGYRWAESFLASHWVFISKTKGTRKMTSRGSKVNSYILDHSDRPGGARAWRGSCRILLYRASWWARGVGQQVWWCGAWRKRDVGQEAELQDVPRFLFGARGCLWQERSPKNPVFSGSVLAQVADRGQTRRIWLSLKSQ